MCQFLVIAYVLLLSQNLSDKMRLLWFVLLLAWMPVSVDIYLMFVQIVLGSVKEGQWLFHFISVCSLYF